MKSVKMSFVRVSVLALLASASSMVLLPAAAYASGVPAGGFTDATQAFPDISVSDVADPQDSSHSYRLVRSDCSWTEAFRRAIAAGGYLAHIDTADEFSFLSKEAENAGMKDLRLRLGARRDEGGNEYYPVDDTNQLVKSTLLNASDSWCANFWMKGEPSFRDGDIKETCLDMFYYGEEGRWVLNDVPDDIISVVPGFSGQLGYIIEFGGENGSGQGTGQASGLNPGQGSQITSASGDPTTITEEEVSQSPAALLSLVTDEFYFSSGAGAWASGLTLHDDGTFTGDYHDSNMGEDTEHYLGGTVYVCNFTGKFTDFRKIDDYTWSMTLSDLQYEQPEDSDWTDGTVHYIASAAYGLAGGTNFLLYLKGHPYSTLPEGYRDWSGMYDYGYTDLSTLNYDGIYNVDEELGWGSGSAYD